MCRFIKSDGSQWEVIERQTTLRPTNSVTPARSSPPRTARPGAHGIRSGRYAIVMGGTGTAYLYDAMADAFTVSNRTYTRPRSRLFRTARRRAQWQLLPGERLDSELVAVGDRRLGEPTSSTTIRRRWHRTRNVAAVAAVDQNRLPAPDDAGQDRSSRRPPCRVTRGRRWNWSNLRNGSVSVVGALAENPPVTRVRHDARRIVPPRLLAVDSSGRRVRASRCPV